MAGKRRGAAAERGGARSAGGAVRPAHNNNRGGWLAIAVIIVVVITAFYPSLAGEFTSWDDEGNIVQNPYLHPVSFAHLVGIWSAPYRSLYIPLVYTSYALE